MCLGGTPSALPFPPPSCTLTRGPSRGGNLCVSRFHSLCSSPPSCHLRMMKVFDPSSIHPHHLLLFAPSFEPDAVLFPGDRSARTPSTPYPVSRCPRTPGQLPKYRPFPQALSSLIRAKRNTLVHLPLYAHGHINALRTCIVKRIGGRRMGLLNLLVSMSDIGNFMIFAFNEVSCRGSSRHM